MQNPRWELVERVAENPLFQKSTRLRNLLLYICERSLQGRVDELREQRIGMDVFGRGADFRPNEDNIVRVEARILRKRLEEYFATDGKLENLIITIPKGAYVAAFQARAEVATQTEDTAPSLVHLIEQPVAPTPKWRFPTIPWIPVLAGTTLLFLALAIWALVRNPQNESAAGAAHLNEAPRIALWTHLFDRDHQTYVVCADSSLVLVQEITAAPITLSEYVNRDYGSRANSVLPNFEQLLKVLPQRQYTSISDVRLVQQVMQINHDFRDRCTIRSARNVQLIDFKSGNFILLGGRFSNPWVELFEPSLNFRFVYDYAAKRPGFSNANPQPGELKTYWIEGNPLQPEQTYSIISYVPNLSHNGNVLMIGGATGEGTEAAGEFITNPELMRQLGNIHALDNGHLAYFEVLLKSGTIAGTSKNAEVVAYRLLSPPR